MKSLSESYESSVLLTVQRRVIYDLSGLQPLPLALTLGLVMLRHVGGDFLCAYRSITAAD